MLGTGKLINCLELVIMGLRGEPITITVLNQHDFQLPSEYSSLQQQRSRALCLHQRKVSLKQLETITEKDNKSKYRE